MVKTAAAHRPMASVEHSTTSIASRTIRDVKRPVFIVLLLSLT